MTTNNQPTELGKTELNDFEAGWLQGEAAPTGVDPGASAAIKDAQDVAARIETEYVQAHTDLESENK